MPDTPLDRFVAAVFAEANAEYWPGQSEMWAGRLREVIPAADNDETCARALAQFCSRRPGEFDIDMLWSMLEDSL